VISTSHATCHTYAIEPAHLELYPSNLKLAIMSSWLSGEQQCSDVTFVSLGMVVLDELRYPGKAPLLDVMGGSGAYSTAINPA